MEASDEHLRLEVCNAGGRTQPWISIAYASCAGTHLHSASQEVKAEEQRLKGILSYTER